MSTIKLICYAVLALSILGGLGWAGCRVKGCVMAEHKAAVLEKAQKMNQKVQDADQKSKENIQEMTHEELLEFGRTGVLSERLRKHRP